jgi:hypothetical protein
MNSRPTAGGSNILLHGLSAINDTTDRAEIVWFSTNGRRGRDPES